MRFNPNSWSPVTNYQHISTQSYFDTAPLFVSPKKHPLPYPTDHLIANQSTCVGVEWEWAQARGGPPAATFDSDITSRRPSPVACRPSAPWNKRNCRCPHSCLSPWSPVNEAGQCGGVLTSDALRVNRSLLEPEIRLVPWRTYVGGRAIWETE